MKLLQTREPLGRLANGPVRRFSLARPKLAAAVTGLPETDLAPTTPRPRRFALTVQTMAGIIAVLAGAIAACWVILGLTILPTVRVEGGLWVVQRAAFPEGQAPHDAVVLATTGPTDRSISGRWRLLTGTDPGARILQVIAGPTDVISLTATGGILVNDQPTGLQASPTLPAGVVGDRYLAICLVGTCGPVNQVLAVDTHHVLGKVLGRYQGVRLAPVPNTSAG